MDWNDVRIFLAVARAGSLSRAAQHLGLSQPTMGRRLRALEKSTGQKLFQRNREGFLLTDEGASVLANAQRMEEEALAMERQLAGRVGQLEGLLRVSCSEWFGTYVLTPVVAAFSVKHPDVRVDLITDVRFYDLSRQEADLVFRNRPFDSPEVVQRKLMELRYALYGPVDRQAPVVGGGRGCRLITLDMALEDLPDVHWLRENFPAARVAAGSNNREAQAHLCALGAGFAVLPKLLGARIAGIQPHEFDPDPPSRDVWMAYHRDLRGLPRLRAFLDVVIESFRTISGDDVAKTTPGGPT